LANYDPTSPAHSFISAFEAAGAIIIGGSQIEGNYAEYSAFSASVTLIARVKYSTAPAGQSSQTFAVTVADECATATIATGMTGLTVGLKTYKKWEVIPIQFTPVESSVAGCPVSYYLVDDQGFETAETRVFDVTMTLADQGRLSGVIELANGEERQWKLVAVLGKMTQLPVPLDDYVVKDEDEWNFIVSDACAVAGILSTKVQPGSTYLFQEEVWVGDAAKSF
jgi:hypothetical protein